MVNRSALPSWVNATIDWIADAPSSPIGRLAARRLGRPEPRGTIPTVSFDDRPIRALVTPLNFAGQATAWARALESASAEVSARSVAIAGRGGFQFEADLIVPIGTFHNDRDWQRRQFDAVADATHLLIESESEPFGRLFGRNLRAQVRAIEARGVRVAYMSHGSDIRRPSRHAADEPWSHFADPGMYNDRAEAVAGRNIAFLEQASTAFVSTPDLLDDLPSGVWCPVVVDVARWEQPSRPPRGDRPLIVAHAPSSPVVKGTPLITPVLERLHAEGVIDFRLMQDVPSARMPDALGQCDVVLDQFRLGSYGVVACEAMAAGCIVIGHVSERVRATVRRETGQDLPVVEATPDTLEAALRGLASQDDLAERRQQGLRFVSEVHDGRRSAQILTGRWLTS